MFSTTIKRSVATLGVVLAGLLAAAGPASAQIGPATIGVKAPRADDRPMEQVSFIRDADNGQAGFCGVDVSADHIEGYVVTNNNDPDAMAIARGTQIGSEGVNSATKPSGTNAGSNTSVVEVIERDEGVKAPSKADNQSKHALEDCMVSGFTFGQGAIPLL